MYVLIINLIREFFLCVGIYLVIDVILFGEFIYILVFDNIRIRYIILDVIYNDIVLFCFVYVMLGFGLGMELKLL